MSFTLMIFISWLYYYNYNSLFVVVEQNKGRNKIFYIYFVHSLVRALIDIVLALDFTVKFVIWSFGRDLVVDDYPLLPHKS